MAAVRRDDKQRGYKMREWKIQRPATMWLEATVDADTLEEALEFVDDRLRRGNYIELEETLEINFEEFWAQDDKGQIYG